MDNDKILLAIEIAHLRSCISDRDKCLSELKEGYAECIEDLISSDYASLNECAARHKLRLSGE